MASPPPCIELRHLRYFLVLFEELHFGHAAARLHMTQPPLSQAIHKLEHELGVKLFERTSRLVVPTEAGHVLAEDARKVLALFDLAVAGARHAGGRGAALRIGCIAGLPLGLLQDFLRTLEETEPDMDTEVAHLRSHEQVRLLREGELDLAILYHAADFADLELQPLLPGDPLHALLPADHPLAGKSVLRPDDLAGEGLVLASRGPDPAVYDRLLATLEAAGFRFRCVHDAPGADRRDVVLAATQGLGVAVGPFSDADLSGAGYLVRRQLDPAPAMPDTALAWLRRPPRHLQSSLGAVLSAARHLRAAASRPGRPAAAPQEAGTRAARNGGG